MANCDLILKWISLRFFETNPTVLLKVLDLALAIFTAIRDNSEPFTDAEMNAFLPYLIMKVWTVKNLFETFVYLAAGKDTTSLLLREWHTPTTLLPFEFSAFSKYSPSFIHISFLFLRVSPQTFCLYCH